jgi:hypothetical protein
LHRRIEEALLDKFATATSEPELLAHHFTQAGMNEAAVEWWGKAGQRSLEECHESNPRCSGRKSFKASRQ